MNGCQHLDERTKFQILIYFILAWYIRQLYQATELYLMLQLPFLRFFFQFTFPVAGVYRRWTNELIHWLGNRVYYGWHMRSSLKLSEPVSSPSFLVIFAHSSTPSLELQLLWQEKNTIRRESLRLIKNTNRRVIVQCTLIPHICHFFYTGKIFGE